MTAKKTGTKTAEEAKTLKSKAVLVKLNVKYGIGFQVADTKATKEVEEKYGIQKAGRYVKNLFRHDDLSDVFEAVRIARRAHDRFTLPWLDAGVRILPVTMFDRYDAELKKAKEAFTKAVGEFIKKYNEVIELNKIRLSDLFDSLNYPSREAMEQGFRLWAGYFPMPDENDFTMTTSDKIMGNIRGQFNEDMKEYEYRAKFDVAERLGIAVKRLFDRLESADKKMRDGQLTKLVVLIEDLKGLNIMEDKGITELIDSVEKNFAKESAEYMNENADYRIKKKKEAQAILTKLEKSFPRAIEF